MYYLCFDIGTSSIKCALIDNDFSIINECFSEYDLIKLPDEKIEQDPNDWWSLIVKTTKILLEDTNIDVSLITAISISSQGISFVPIDEKAKPLMNAISWLDAKRSIPQSIFVSEKMGNASFWKITGSKVSSSKTLSKLLWMKQCLPDIYIKTYKILSAHDYILFKLCGEIMTDHTMACGTQLYDINERRWSDDIMQTFDLKKEILPMIRESGSFAGKITEKAASELGIKSDVYVIVGGQDQKCAVLGSGLHGNEIAVSLGTAAAISKKIDRAYTSDNMNIPCCVDVIKGKWIMEGVVGTAGAGLKWMKDTLYNDLTYAELDTIAANSPKGNLFFYPHLSGAGTPVNNNNIRGFIYGISLSTTKGEILRSYIEGVAFQIKKNIDILSNSFGDVDRIRIYGGGSKSLFWAVTLANVTGKKIFILKNTETACIGAAMLCSMGIGKWKGSKDAHEMLEIKRVIEPESGLHGFYLKMYSDYVKIENKLIELY